MPEILQTALTSPWTYVALFSLWVLQKPALSALGKLRGLVPSGEKAETNPLADLKRRLDELCDLLPDEPAKKVRAAVYDCKVGCFFESE